MHPSDCDPNSYTNVSANTDSDADRYLNENCYPY